MTIRQVACIGAGPIGRSWAIKFAASGLSVYLCDISTSALERAKIEIAAALMSFAEARLLQDAEAAIARVRYTTELALAVAEADYVQECVGEELDLKRAIFKLIDEASPVNAIIASSVSQITPSAFMEHLEHRHRCLVAHPANPPHLLPVVEMCASPWTDPRIMADATDFMESIGQKPVLIEKEIYGYVLNRLQFALFGEALHLVSEGYCSPAVVDKCVKFGLGLRWALLGPFEVAHLNADGLMAYVNSDEVGLRQLCANVRPGYEWSMSVIEQIEANCFDSLPKVDIDVLQRRRDEALLGLLAHIQANAKSPHPWDASSREG